MDEGDADAASTFKAVPWWQSVEMDRLLALQKQEGDYYGGTPNVASAPMSSSCQRRRSPRTYCERSSSYGTSNDATRMMSRGGGGTPRRGSPSTGGPAIGAIGFARFRYRAKFGKAWGTISSWAYEVVDYYGLPRGAVAWMMYYVDRVLSQRSSLAISDNADPTNKEFLLLSITSFYLALKLTCSGAPAPTHSTHSSSSWSAARSNSGGTRSAETEHRMPRRIPMSVLLELGKRQFTARQVSDTEMRILQLLNWRVHPPTPDLYVPDLVEVCCGPGPARGVVYDCALYLVELSVVNHYFLDFHPSEIAVAAMSNAQHLTMRRVGPSVDENDGDSSHGNDNGPCVILPSQFPTAFRVEPIHVLPGVDPVRVAWCRLRLTEMIDKQRQMQQQLMVEVQKTPSQPCGDATAVRTSSPVSVVHHGNDKGILDVANLAVDGPMAPRGTNDDPVAASHGNRYCGDAS